ncbi:MAG TPA: hypothetical protein VN739_07210 [Nitrososphaerales archaeon]|nr:hypothetical protein [Nitrososphaerales archaeon]
MPVRNYEKSMQNYKTENSGVMEVVLNATLSILASTYDKKSSTLSISCKVDWKNSPIKPDL